MNRNMLTLILSGVMIMSVSDTLRAEEKPQGTTTNMNVKYQKTIADLEAYESSGDLDVLGSILGQMEALLKVPENQMARDKKAELFLRVLAAVEKSTDPDYDPDDRPEINVQPPNERYRAGISPESIKDKSDRKKYEEAIAKNRTKAETYRYQSNLLRNKKKIIERMKKFVGEAYPERDIQALEELRKDMDGRGVSMDAKEAISQVIKSLRQKE